MNLTADLKIKRNRCPGECSENCAVLLAAESEVGEFGSQANQRDAIAVYGNGKAILFIFITSANTVFQQEL